MVDGPRLAQAWQASGKLSWATSVLTAVRPVTTTVIVSAHICTRQARLDPASRSDHKGLRMAESIDAGQLGRLWREPEHVEVGRDALTPYRLRDHHEPVVDVPPQHDLRR